MTNVNSGMFKPWKGQNTLEMLSHEGKTLKVKFVVGGDPYDPSFWIDDDPGGVLPSAIQTDFH